MEASLLADGAPTPSPSRTSRLRVLSVVLGVACVVAFVCLSVTGGSHGSATENVSDEEKLFGLFGGSTDPDDKFFTSFYKTNGCPYSKWFSSASYRIADWEKNMLDKYNAAFQKACESQGCPEGFDINDHNYNTLLGQGNTLGFVAGNLRVYDNLPKSIRHGLFEEAKTRPVIGRFSDFGADGSIQLARLALKLPYDAHTSRSCGDGEGGSWYGEMNLLFTESMDAFPLADYGDIMSFASDPDASTWDTLSTTAHFIQVMAQSGWSVMMGQSKGLGEKDYYSQLPYQLGCDNAIKYKLVPVDTYCPSKSSDLIDHLERCTAIFELQIQVKSLKNKNDLNVINKQASSRWDEPYISVAELRFPPQTMSSSSTAPTSSSLYSVLTNTLSLPDFLSVGVHKLFAFHPLLSPGDHRPLGEVNSFRSNFYAHHAHARFDTIQKDLYERAVQPTPGKPVYKVSNAVWSGKAAVEGMDELRELFGLTA